jgi:hypothetical protein
LTETRRARQEPTLRKPREEWGTRKINCLRPSLTHPAAGWLRSGVPDVSFEKALNQKKPQPRENPGPYNPKGREP